MLKCSETYPIAPPSGNTGVTGLNANTFGVNIVASLVDIRTQLQIAKSNLLSWHQNIIQIQRDYLCSLVTTQLGPGQHFKFHFLFSLLESEHEGKQNRFAFFFILVFSGLLLSVTLTSAHKNYIDLYLYSYLYIYHSLLTSQWSSSSSLVKSNSRSNLSETKPLISNTDRRTAHTQLTLKDRFFLYIFGGN